MTGCADAAQQRGDVRLGTAAPTARWLLVEQDAGWRRGALESLAVTDAQRAEVGVALKETKSLLRIIRRPGAAAHARTEPPRWGVVDARAGTEAWGIRDADGTLDAALEALRDPASGGAGEGVLLVCAHGKHDPCCAVRGRPVAAALAEEWPDLTWESSHFGGCRFAGNLAVMPDGAVYGWVPAEEAVALVRAHRAGEGNLTHLRGVLGATPAEQAALAAVASGLGVTHWDRRLTATVVSTARGWTVTVRLDGRPVREVRGHDAVRAPHELTCGSGRPSKAIVPTVDAVAPVAH